MCTLRALGRTLEAEALRTGEIEALTGRLRAESSDSDAAWSARLAGVLAAEEERVANATVLAEVLLPLLRGESPVPPVPPPAAASPVRVRLETAPARSAPAAPRPTASITDFLDEMIAQETAPAALSPGRPPRAS